MNAKVRSIEDIADELLIVLDRDIRHVDESLLRLNELRSLVIRRDDAALGGLLERIRAESDSYVVNESQRRSIREELATGLGCASEQMTLSRLEAALSTEKKAQVTQRKTRLRSVIAELKKEHLSTALLLSECARFNTLLLKSIFDLGRTDAIIYSSDGKTSRQVGQSFVNLKF
jgi:hypothetical protein